MQTDGRFQIPYITEITIETSDFDLEKTLFSGQAFRWQKTDDAYRGFIDQTFVIAYEKTLSDSSKFDASDDSDDLVDPDDLTEPNDRKPLKEVQKRRRFGFKLYGERLTEERIRTYFDLNRDYAPILRALSEKDEHLNAAIAYGKGLRIMKQPEFEMLITFILSSNNNIPKITMTVEALCEKFGRYLGDFEGKSLYGFPTVMDLKNASEDDLKVKAIGYRAKSVYETVQAIVHGQLDLSTAYTLSHEDRIKWLEQFYGVGLKVASCIALFGYADDTAFPVDTWVKKVLAQLYGVEKGHEAFVKQYFDEHPGIAQQYLFYYIREAKNT